jgi:dihydroxy-acid dehydratase
MGRDGNRTDLQRLRSRITVEGLDRAPHRAFLRAMGLDDAAMARPFIGVVSTAGEMTPCNMTLSQQVAAMTVATGFSRFLI